MSIPGGFTLPVRNRKPAIPVIAGETLKLSNLQLSTDTILGIGDVFLIFTYPFSAKAVPIFCLYVVFNLGLSLSLHRPHCQSLHKLLLAKVYQYQNRQQANQRSCRHRPPIQSLIGNKACDNYGQCLRLIDA